jgi:hypothetical protein
VDAEETLGFQLAIQRLPALIEAALS